MKNEKLAAILLVIVIVGSVLVFLTVTYGPGILNNSSGKKTGGEVIALGDCVDVNYIGRYASNNTIFASSYAHPTNKTGGAPLKIFVSTNASESSPTGYENYTNLINDSYVKGFIEGLIGLKEGATATIGPILPEDAYGVYPKVGDVITISDPSLGKDYRLRILDITNNSAMPADYQDAYGNETTTLFVLRDDSYSLGEKTTIYPSWENATVVTAINETKMSMYTTPPDDKITNFTWVYSDGYTYVAYPDNSSSVKSINDTTIVVTHNPQIGATMTDYDMSYGTTTSYTIVNVTTEKINISYYDDTTGETSYSEINRTVIINRNETQNLTYAYPTQVMDQLLSYIKEAYVPNLTLSVNKLAGESLIYEVQIVKIYKIS